MGVVTKCAPTSVTIQADTDGMLYDVYMRNDEETMYMNDVRMVSRVYHMPPMGANAITIHKSQGLTLTRAVLFLNDCIPSRPGLAYTALSRCATECGVYLGEAPHPSVAFPHYAYTTFMDKISRTTDAAHHSVHVWYTECHQWYLPLWTGGPCTKFDHKTQICKH